jgi:hypothetical protein
MLFHVTITHSPADCPGRRPAETPDLIGPADRLEALGAEFSVTSHSLAWGAACILWAAPEHVAYALLEAPSLEAVEGYIGALIPPGWESRAQPVFLLPTQLETVRQILSLPVVPHVQPPPVVVAEPAAEVDSAEEDHSADTLKRVTVSTPPEEPPELTPQPPPEEERPDLQVTRAIPTPIFEPPHAPSAKPPDEQITRAIPIPVVEQPVAPAPEPLDKQITREIPQAGVEQPVAPSDRASPSSSAVTRFIERPALLESRAGAAPRPDQPETPAPSVTPSQPFPSSESTTVILDTAAQGMAGMQLVAKTGPAQGSVFEVGEAGATLGRLPDNSICLTDGRLSRHHAQIEFRDGAYWLRDLASQNGTLVNDRPLTEAHRLQAGDSIELGTTRLTVMLESDD